MKNIKMQKTFVAKMLEDYNKGILNDALLKPYFDWKKGESSLPTLNQCMDIINVALGLLAQLYERHPNASKLHGDDESNPWNNYIGYEEDQYVVSYLEAIDSETSYWIINGLVK